MKKIIVSVALICSLGAAAVAARPSVDVSNHAVRDTMSNLAMMQVSQLLPTEAYDAI
jgi:hypothetical protein